MWILRLKGLNRKGVDINWLLKISISNTEKEIMRTDKMIAKRKMLFKEMYEDQPGVFV